MDANDSERPRYLPLCPAGYRFRGLWRFRDLDLVGVDGAELARSGRLGDGANWAVVRFEPGEFRLRFHVAAKPAAT